MAKLLIMEDDEAQAYAWSEALTDAGHEVESCSNGTAAYEAMLHKRYDLLITDILVKQDGRFVSDGGVLLISRLRLDRSNSEYPWLKELPILAISGGISVPGGYDPLAIAGTVGADAMLKKPVPLEALIMMVNRLLEARRSA